MVDEEIPEEIDCADILDEVRELQKVKGTPLALEQILTQKRLPVIIRGVDIAVCIHVAEAILPGAGQSTNACANRIHLVDGQ